jgi:hypothetical protein
MRRQEVSRLGFPGAETLKPAYIHTYIHIHTYIYIYIYILITPSISGIRKPGFWDWRVQENLPIGISGTEIPKYPILSMLSHFDIPPFRISRYVKTRGLAPRFPESRKLRVIKTLNMLLYFRVSSIRISLIGVSRLVNSWGPHLGTPGAEIPKYNHFSTLYSFEVSSSRDFRTYEYKGNLPLGFSGTETLKC